jgi:hypothetical protein
VKAPKRKQPLWLIYALFTPLLCQTRRNGRVDLESTTLCVLALGVVGTFAVRALEVLFACGVVGSALVVVITFMEDLKEVFSTNEPPHFRERPVSAEHVHARDAAV